MLESEGQTSRSAAEMDVSERLHLSHGRRPTDQFPLAIINVTNRCNLQCEHCFVYRDGNPNESQSPRLEMSSSELVETLTFLRDRHGISLMLWMGGEPLLRKDVLAPGIKLFARNIITTNGTLPLVDYGPNVIYVISLDGPAEINDAVRGKRVYERVLKTLDAIPEQFQSSVQIQCTVTARNQHVLEDLVREITDTNAEWMTFSFYVPSSGDDSELAWPDLDSRMEAVREVQRLKAKYPDFIRNRSRSLEYMAPEVAPFVTKSCLPKKMLLPLYLEGDHFTTPFCCYGDDVDCSRCGGWVVFDMAARAGVGPEQLEMLVTGDIPQYGLAQT